MRITCPGCGAQYEVADDAIPPGGRDVQCSACGNVWLVTGAAQPALQAESADPDEPDEPDASTEADEPEPEPAATPRRPALSPEVTAILREEAERERARREAERAAQEVVPQPELGLEEAMEPVRRRVDEAREHMADLRAASSKPPTEPQPPEPGESDSPRGRERLPDIEEINASLRAATERAPAHVADAPDKTPRSGGFRTGFLGMISLACLALAVYLGAPRIAESVPVTAPHLERYVEGVDGLRLWLDRQVQGLLPPE